MTAKPTANTNIAYLKCSATNRYLVHIEKYAYYLDVNICHNRSNVPLLLVCNPKVFMYGRKKHKELTMSIPELKSQLKC